jgi:DNA-binding HxlR family transcriptional regulator
MGGGNGEFGVEDAAPIVFSTLRSSACAQTAPKRPVLAPTTATALPRRQLWGNGLETQSSAFLSKQTMTTMVRLLERDGLVERRADPSDGRASLVFLTERARRFRPVAEATLSELDRRVVRALSARGRAELPEALRVLADL